MAPGPAGPVQLTPGQLTSQDAPATRAPPAVREQHPRLHHSMQTHPAVVVGFKLATDGIHFAVVNRDSDAVVVLNRNSESRGGAKS